MKERIDAPDPAPTPHFGGVFTALATPFRVPAGPGAEPEPDYEAFTALCERQIAASVAGLVPCGTTGETPTLAIEEWRELIRIARSCAGGERPVVAGCGTNHTAGTVARVREAKKLGADAALVVLPYYNKPTPRGLRSHVEACAAVGLPLVVYHVPGRTGQRVAPSVLADLCAVPGVVAVKEATGDIGYANDLLARVDLPVLSGDDATFFPLCALGGAGVISVVSNVAPRATVALHDAVARGDLAGAQARHFRLLPLMRWLFHTTSPLPCKALLAARGLARNQARLPLVALEDPIPPHILDLTEE